MAATVPSEAGFHGVACPVTGSSAATPLRAAPPMSVKSPHASSVLSVAVSAYTISPVGLGFHGSAAPVARSSAARPIRGTHGPMLEKRPPAYTVSPETARASTRWLEWGSHPN